MRNQRGLLTMVEIMIILATCAICAAIAIPVYLSYTEKQDKDKKEIQAKIEEILEDDYKLEKGLVIIIYYAHKPDFQMVAGELAEKWQKDQDNDQHFNWRMGKHFHFNADPHYNGNQPHYTIKPPQKEAFYCPSDFRIMVSLKLDNLQKALHLLGYKKRAIEESVYAVKCIFGESF